MKVLSLVSFVVLITCYVAYRVGAFDGLFSEKIKNDHITPKKVIKENLKNNKMYDGMEDELMSDSKSSPFLGAEDIAEAKQINAKPEKSTKNSQANSESNKAKKDNSKKGHMGGTKSAKVFDLKDDAKISNDEKLNPVKTTTKPPAPIQKNEKEEKIK
jgi:hypothetical protein